jgi:hypothetical protein
MFGGFPKRIGAVWSAPNTNFLLPVFGMTEPSPSDVSRLVFYNPDFNGKDLETLRTHALFGPVVEKFLAEGRTDFYRLKAQLRLLQLTAKRKRKWISAFSDNHDEVEACQKAKVLYQTFCRWRNMDEDFKAKYEALREMRGRELVKVARANAHSEEGSVDRWNLIKTEVPEYNPKKQVATVNLSLNGDIDFSPKGKLEGPKPVETTIEND